VVVGCEFGVIVESLSCVHVGSFLVVFQYLHSVVYGAERMCFSIKVFCEARCVAIVPEGLLVLVISYIEAFPVCPTYAFLHSGQVSLYTPDNENLSEGGLFRVSRFPMVLFVRKAILRSVCLNILVM